MLTGKRILVTSGGTQEYIDDVRVLTNISSGKLGAMIAADLIVAGSEVTYLHGTGAVLPNLMYGYPTSHPAYNCQVTKSAQDAYNEMEKLVPAMDAVIHCMAVSDFTFKRDGALKCKSSDPQAFIDYMSRTITKNPKIISKVKEWNPRTVLVGFKFEVGLAHEDLISVARASMDKNRCDIVIANDKEEMKRDKNHTAYMIYPNEGFDPVKMSGKEDIALHIRDYLNGALK